MKKDITQFISKKSREQNVIEIFNRMLAKTKTKKDVRELEMKLLRPKPLDQYKGPKPGKSAYKHKVIQVTFPNKKYIKQWSDHFKVNSYVQNNTYDVDFLIELLALMEKGIVSWDSKKKKYYINAYQMENNEINIVNKQFKRKIKRRQK